MNQFQTTVLYLLRKGCKCPYTRAWNICLYFQPPLQCSLCLVCVVQYSPLAGAWKKGEWKFHQSFISSKTEESKTCKIAFTRRLLMFSEWLALVFSAVDLTQCSFTGTCSVKCIWLLVISSLSKCVMNCRLKKFSFLIQHVMEQSTHAFRACSLPGE